MAQYTLYKTLEVHGEDKVRNLKFHYEEKTQLGFPANPISAESLGEMAAKFARVVNASDTYGTLPSDQHKVSNGFVASTLRLTDKEMERVTNRVVSALKGL